MDFYQELMSGAHKLLFLLRGGERERERETDRQRENMTMFICLFMLQCKQVHVTKFQFIKFSKMLGQNQNRVDPTSEEVC